MSRRKRKVAELGDHALSAAVGDVVSRTMSAAVDRHDANDQLERLGTLLLAVHSAVDEAERVHIAGWWLRRWLWRLRDAALDGDEVQRLFRGGGWPSWRPRGRAAGSGTPRGASRARRGACCRGPSAAAGTVAATAYYWTGSAARWRGWRSSARASATSSSCSSWRSRGRCGRLRHPVPPQKLAAIRPSPSSSVSRTTRASTIGVRARPVLHFGRRGRGISQAEYMACTVTAIGLRIVTRRKLLRRATTAKLRSTQATAGGDEGATATDEVWGTAAANLSEDLCHAGQTLRCRG